MTQPRYVAREGKGYIVVVGNRLVTHHRTFDAAADELERARREPPRTEDTPLPDDKRLSLHKPRHGAPCNRCGMCCFDSLCQLAELAFGPKKGPSSCPALAWNADGTANCELMSAPEKHVPERVKIHGAQKVAEATKLLHAAGEGCTARFGEPVNQEFRERLDKRAAMIKAELQAAAKVWGRQYREGGN